MPLPPKTCLVGANGGRILVKGRYPWLPEDDDALENTLKGVTGHPVDWEGIGRSLKPERTGGACQLRAKGKGMPYPKAGSFGANGERIRVDGHYLWLPADDDALENALSGVTGRPVNWEGIGISLIP